MENTKKVVLFVNHQPGIQVTNYLANISCEQIKGIYYNSQDLDYHGKLVNEVNVDSRLIFSSALLTDPDHLNVLKNMEIDYIITVYWPFLLPKSIFCLAKKGTVNFHPALLPINRGWYPHVHSIIDGSPAGVTLHAIDENADTGPIWVQKEVKISPYDTAKSLYERLQKEIVQLFFDNWEKIKTETITPIPQDNLAAVYHKKSEINQLDKINLDEKYTAREMINLLRARSFGDKGFAYYHEDGQVVYINVRLSREQSFK